MDFRVQTSEFRVQTSELQEIKSSAFELGFSAIITVDQTLFKIKTYIVTFCSWFLMFSGFL